MIMTAHEAETLKRMLNGELVDEFDSCDIYTAINATLMKKEAEAKRQEELDEAIKTIMVNNCTYPGISVQEIHEQLVANYPHFNNITAQIVAREAATISQLSMDNTLAIIPSYRKRFNGVRTVRTKFYYGVPRECLWHHITR